MFGLSRAAQIWNIRKKADLEHSLVFVSVCVCMMPGMTAENDSIDADSSIDITSATLFPIQCGNFHVLFCV